MMHSRSFVTRTLLACVAIGALALLAGACSSSSSSKTTPTIQFETPSVSPSAAAPSSTAATEPSSEPSSAASSTATGGATGGATVIDLTAHDIKFDKSSITVPAGGKVTIKLDNEDKLPHNFAAYTKKDGDELFAGQIFTGPKTVEESFTAPAKAGDYYFQCDVHPAQMNGTLVVQ